MATLAEQHLPTPIISGDWTAALHEAVRYGKHRLVRILLESAVRSDVNRVNEMAETPLYTSLTSTFLDAYPNERQKMVRYTLNM